MTSTSLPLLLLDDRYPTYGLNIDLPGRKNGARVLIDTLVEGLRLFGPDTALCGNNCYHPGPSSKWCLSDDPCSDRPPPYGSTTPWSCAGDFPSRIPDDLGYQVPRPYALGLEAAVVDEERVEGFEVYGIPGAAAAAALRAVKYVRNISAPITLPPNLQGVLGLGDYDCRSSHSSTTIRETLRAAALGFSFRDHKIYLMDDPATLSTSMIHWAEKASPKLTVTQGLMTFPMYHFRLNDLNLLAATSSHWLAMLDFASPCLRLPPFLLYRLLRQLQPRDCPVRFNMKQHFPLGPQDVPLCRLPESRGVYTDWYLQFELAETANQTVQIPLSDLILFDNQLCVTPSRAVGLLDASAMAETYSPPIMLGQLAARRLMTVFDYQLGAVGFELLDGMSETVRMAPLVCEAGETGLTEVRLCVPPVCSLWGGEAGGSEGCVISGGEVMGLAGGVGLFWALSVLALRLPKWRLN